ncbi:tyrosine decarboxylase/aspartate 1-decarboxylase [Methanohalophilus levihalophilus]|nr:tyrosine decarboxylase MfnA [Methanohalophilus levihalophilus]MBP2029916.1 tyrosine decarboxylase/aspartate 1-decarboxylase [Methanohalophilus levihalophilus]
MNKNGVPEKDVLNDLAKIRSLDTPYEKVLSSMCTYPHPIAALAHQDFLEANMGDPGLFKGTTILEEKVIKLLGELSHKPDACGYLSTGGTESNIQAIRAMKNCSNSKKPNVILPQSAHFSFEKTANLTGVEMRRAKLDPDLRVSINSVEDLIDDNTIGLVGIAGTTEFGQIDDIQRLSYIAEKNDLFLHVDAAFGGFVIPFLKKHYSYDFEVSGVSSITVDPHKMGLSTIPSGGLLFRDKTLFESLSVHTPYLTVRTQSSLTGTRSGAAVAATYAVMTHLGMDGYQRIVDNCMEMTRDLVSGAKERGFSTVINPVMNVVCLETDFPEDLQNSLLSEYGWRVSVTHSPQSLRLVVMPHLSKDIISEFLDDLASLV